MCSRIWNLNPQKVNRQPTEIDDEDDEGDMDDDEHQPDLLQSWPGTTVQGGGRAVHSPGRSSRVTEAQCQYFYVIKEGQRSSNMGWPLRAEVCCAATSEDEEAAEQLAQLEAELEALEDEMEEDRQERVRRADQDQAAAMNKINAKFDSISAPSKSSVTAGRGASSHGLGSVALCGTGEVAEQLLERLKKEAPDNQQPVFLNLAEVSRHKFSNKTLILLLPVALRFAQDFFFGQQTSGKMMQSAAPSSASQVTNLAMVENRSASLPTIPFHGPLRPGFTKGKAHAVREDTRPARFANQGLLAPAPGTNAPSSFHE
ncbi:unnamed protein product, partial [Symbiodinium microadriaticum]